MIFSNYARLHNLDSSNIDIVMETSPAIGDAAKTMMTELAESADTFDFATLTVTPGDPGPGATTYNFSRFTLSDAPAETEAGAFFAFVEAWHTAMEIDEALEAQGLDDVHAFAFRNDAGGYDVGVLDLVVEPGAVPVPEDPVGLDPIA